MDILQTIIATKREELALLKSPLDPKGRLHSPSEQEQPKANVPDGSPSGNHQKPARPEGALAQPVGARTANSQQPMANGPQPSLREALLNSDTGIIAEFKRRSPSKGWIKEEGRPDVIPLSYQQNGAAALSILTDQQYFGGHDDFIRIARASGVTLPILYKNFVIDEAQLYAALACGASAVLLIAACLSKADCANLISKAHALGLEVLLEMHSEEELEYATLGPDLCGINNRHLGSFHTDVATSFHLAEKLRAIVSFTDPTPTPPLDGRGVAAQSFAVDQSVAALLHSSVGNGAATPLPSRGGVAEGRGGVCNIPPVLVSESGISDPQTVKELRAAGFRGFLIGETFMREPDPGQALHQFLHQLSH